MEYYLPRILQVGKGLFQAPHQPSIYTNNVKLFNNIQIQTIEFCNLKCDFCPNHYIIWDRIENKKKEFSQYHDRRKLCQDCGKFILDSDIR